MKQWLCYILLCRLRFHMHRCCEDVLILRQAILSLYLALFLWPMSFSAWIHLQNRLLFAHLDLYCTGLNTCLSRKNQSHIYSKTSITLYH